MPTKEQIQQALKTTAAKRKAQAVIDSMPVAITGDQARTLLCLLCRAEGQFSLGTGNQAWGLICTCGEMVAMSSATKKTVKPGTKKSFMCHSCGCDIGESTPYHGSGERPDRIYCHADGSNCKAKVPKREDNSSCGLCEEVSPTIYATGNMDDSSLYRCEMCFFAQRAALLDDIAAGNAEKKKKKREMDCKPSAPDTPRPHLKKARLSADGGSSANAAGFSNDGAGSSSNTS